MVCENCGGGRFRPTPFYYFWNNKEFVLKKCRQCDLITLDPKPDESELGLLYSDDYFQTGAHGLNKQQKTYEELRDQQSMDNYKTTIRNTVLKYNPQTKGIFEIGFAMGHMLAAAKEMGLEVSGIEFSETAMQKAKDKFGIDVKSGNFENIDTAALGKYDCVFGGDVFEHFVHPRKVVDNMYDMLNDGGVAIVIVPSTFNLFSTKLAIVFYKILGKRKRFYDNPYHLSEFTSATIKNIFKKRFEEVRVINNIKKPSQLNLKTSGLEYKLKYAVHLINYPFTKIFNRNGDRLTVIARKNSLGSIK
ncbi:MAG: class I SAM-dependent methyltransferase [Chitinophagales bacterium]